MPKQNKLAFNVIFIGIILTLLLVVYHYNEAYWLNFLGLSSLSVKHRILLHLAQILTFSFILFIILFRKAIYNKRKEFALMISSVVFIFIILEISSRVYLCKFANEGVQKKYLFYGQCGKISLFSPHQYLNYQNTPNYRSPDGLNMHNSMGFRGPEIVIPKPKDVFRIVILGGSTTYEVAIKDWRNDFARQLERRLQSKYNNSRIEVINAGVGGYNSWESLINLEFKVLDTEPDMIIMYDGTNDVLARAVNPIYYRGDNSGSRKQWGEKKFPIVFRLTFIRLVTGISSLSTLGHFIHAPGTVLPQNMSFVEALETNKPVYSERNYANIVAIARANNIDVLLATYAYTHQLHGFETEQYHQNGVAEHREVVKRVGAKYGVPVYDYAAEMPEDKKYWDDGIHVNVEGAKIKGELFANYIYRNKLMDKKLAQVRKA